MTTILNLLALCKLKVVSLILLTAIVGMLLTPSPFMQIGTMIIATIGIGLSASSAAVFNHIIDNKIDSKMARTNRRPIPKGDISIKQAFIWGISIGTVGIALLFIFINQLTALLTLLSIIGYAVFYTIYLKRATPQNIVIGGAAGATPPILGWSSMTNSVGELSILLFLIIFIWTPPHFWALAIHRYKEYEKVNIPMLPVTHGLGFTRLQILLYTILLFIVTMLPYITAHAGLIYLVGSVILNIIFLTYAIKLVRNVDDDSIAWRTFSYSIKYLIILFIVIFIDHNLII